MEQVKRKRGRPRKDSTQSTVIVLKNTISMKEKKRLATYNEDHVQEKYNDNIDFINIIKPKSILDTHAHQHSFYTIIKLKQHFTHLITQNRIELFDSLNKLNHNSYKVTANDNGSGWKGTENLFTTNDYNLDCDLLLYKLLAEEKTFDIVDCDPFGDSYLYLDRIIQLSNKGFIISNGFASGRCELSKLKHFYHIKNKTNLVNDITNYIIQRAKILFNKEVVLYKSKKWNTFFRLYFIIKE